MNDLNRTYNEKIKALIITHKLPVAVKGLEELRQFGDCKRLDIEGKAYVLNNIRNPEISTYMGDHIWVDPNLSKYKYEVAWSKAGFSKMTGFHDLDHLHSKARAIKQGYGFVLMHSLPIGPNRSAGHIESELANNEVVGYANLYRIYYANEVHWAKLWSLNQIKDGQLTKETTGKR